VTERNAKFEQVRQAEEKAAAERAEKDDEKDRPDKKAERVEKKAEKKDVRMAKAPAKEKGTGESLKSAVDGVRSRLASLVWLVAVVCALFLAVGALLIALKMNQQNGLVSFVVDGANKLDFGDFKKFTGKNAATKGHLVNWGIAAVIYLVVGKVLDRLIRP
jgi:hypothetical protein